jgi:hypothetical protein
MGESHELQQTGVKRPLNNRSKWRILEDLQKDEQVLKYREKGCRVIDYRCAGEKKTLGLGRHLGTIA